ncbi:SusC/RagA family TonB-linked outer membrane protein [Pedobacter sp. UBA4863]|uniref:SusC/RagA family TonB-linked outer membrane protein n=1 Tax=Pedobacter sp. UBA4863 TaxID=1947060 RepID=UPI0025FD6814|nr:SusC/RagA family TonB-linked outer membrane protein [Pedobacter sp. UBA4863]
MRKFFTLIFTLLSLTNYTFAQSKTISGKVTDDNGTVVQGATIRVLGTNKGVVTDTQGAYSITANPNDQLEFSYLGFGKQIIKVGTQSTINVRLVENDSQTLQGVVITALGIKRAEKSLGYATQVVKGNTLQTVKGIDVATSLTGRVSGLTIKNSSEFMTEPDITLRGEKPLIVIDGVPYGNISMRDISSDDIETVNFLKGASASALYGERGGSGAIMITTKKGAEGNGLSITLNTSTMFEAGYLAIPEMQGKYGRVVNTATNTYVGSADGAWGPPLEGQSVKQWDPVSKSYKAMPYLPIGKDNFANFQEQGYILNNNLSIAQSGSLGGFRASASWMNNKGTYPNSKFNKVTYSVGGDIKLNKFSLSTSIAYNNYASPNMGFGGYTGYDPMYALLIWAAPDFDVRQYKDYWAIPNEKQNNSYTAGSNNPYFDRYERIKPYKKDVFNGQLTLNYDLTPWLKATVRTGYDTYSNKQEVRISKGSFQGGGVSKVIDGGTEIWGESQKGSYNVGLSRGFSTNNEALLSWNKRIKDFVIDGFVGGSVFYTQNEGMEARTNAGLSIPGYYSLKSSVSPVNVGSILYKKQTNSFFGKIGVSWKDMAFIEATGRNDWASTLPTSNRSYFYPSVAGSFIASELVKADWLSFWKLRASWTQYKTPASIYAINNVFNISNNVWNGMAMATFPNRIRPNDIFAEGATTFEYGTTLNFLKNRISLDFTAYQKRMYDFIVNGNVSPASGYTGVFTNSKEERTRKGIEFTLNTTPVKNSTIKWDLGFNWSKFATYYTELDPTYSVNNRDWVKKGLRADHYTINEYQTDNAGNIVFNAGKATYKPITTLVGYADPDWIWGINSSVAYKDFTLSVSLDGRVGGKAQSTTEMYMWISGNHPNSLTEERYKDATITGSKNYLGNGVKVVSGSITYDANYHVISDTRVFAPNDVYVTYKDHITSIHKGTAWGGNPSPVDLYSTTFMKLRELALTYTLPNKWAGKIKAKNLSVSAIGQNLIYWSKQFKYSDIDGGTENFADPSLRYVGFNLKIGF